MYISTHHAITDTCIGPLGVDSPCDEIIYKYVILVAYIHKDGFGAFKMVPFAEALALSSLYYFYVNNQD